MENSFKISGEITSIKIENGDKSIVLKHTSRNFIPICLNSSLKIEKYSIGETVEIEGQIRTYSPLNAVKLIATKITRN